MADVLTVVARIYPRAGQEDAVQALLLKMADAVRRHEPDCLIYRPHRLEGQAPIFLFYEQYRAKADYDAHLESEHIKQWGLGDAIPRLESRERTFYETWNI